MDSVLEKRLRAVFPTGKDWEPDEERLGPREQIQRLVAALRSVQGVARIEHISDASLVNSFVVTDPRRISFQAWLAMRNPAKLAWLDEHGAPFVAWWFEISKVADYFLHHHNHWRARGDSGYLDARIDEPPIDGWPARIAKVGGALEAHGFTLAAPAFLQQPVPFVKTTGDALLESDDPRHDDPDFEAPIVDATVHGCLFGDR